MSLDEALNLAAEKKLDIKYISKMDKRIEAYRAGTKLYGNMKNPDDIDALWNLIRDEKKRINKLDFDDLIRYATDIYDSSLYTPKWIIIDEFQDCDHIQMDILKLLNKNSSLFAVGDEDQCIYSFRGSRPDYMVEFNQHFKGGRKYFLSTNYRSTENIVDISSNLIKNNICRNEKKMTSFKKEKKLLDVLRYKDENTQAEDISLRIEKLKLLNCCEYKDTAVLYRTNMESRSLIDAFLRKKIPFKLLDKEYNFFDHFICRDIIAYLKLSIIRDDIESFIRIINKPFRYISKITLEKLRSSVYKEDCFDAIKQMESTPVFQMKNLDKLQKQINSLNKMSLMSAVQYITTDLGYHDYIREYCLKFKIDITELENILEELIEAAKPFNSILTFLTHIEQVREEFEKNLRKSSAEDYVILSTIHGVKGMEFKNVFIINCVEEIMPHINSIDTHLEEERRLFFVAVTRAMDNIFICMPENIRGKYKEPSRFIEECKINMFENLQAMYAEGEEVIHNSFGKGKIIKLDNNVVEIQFENSINRKFDIVVLHNNGIIKKLS
jgi:DNA helicase-2/ATP-dependent DNA helicase PcrA